MGIMGSAFGRALAGGGAAVASLSAKYIDEELAQQRMQAHAELQRLTAKNIREDDDAFRNDPTRIARDRENRKQDALATAATARQAELEGLNDTALQGARESQKDRDAAGDTRRKVAGRKTELEKLASLENKAAADRATAEGDARAELQKKYGNDPLFLKAMRNEAAANYIESAASVAQAKLTEMKIADEKRLGVLYTDLLSLSDSPESAARRKTIEREITIIKSRNGTAGDKSEKGPRVKEEVEYDVNGKMSSRKVTTEGPAGAASDRAPYEDGTELRGKDGKVYVVKGGQAVLKEAAPKSQAQGQAAPARQPAGERPKDEADLATERRAAAERELQRWGSVQRQRDPGGYERAKQALDEAKAEERSALNRVMGDAIDKGPSFRMATP